MCGRYTQTRSARQLAEAFEADLNNELDLLPRYNIAPTQPMVVVRATPRGREVALMRWGLIPSWAKDPSIGSKMINARCETVHEKPAYRSAFRSRRCLIPADGFYEWKKTGGRKQPMYIHRRDGQPLAFAGLWERWQGDGEPVETCTILTTEPNALMAPIHDRMPVIVEPQDYAMWLDPKVHDDGQLARLLQPCAAERLMAYPVSSLVNSPKNDTTRCIEPIEDVGELWS